jgi:UDP-N-acetylmuramoyl-tripeptide--D-alanyl-D-alanine ligase
MELGMSGAGELTKLSELADPSIGVITNVGPGHLAFFDSVEQIAVAKGELLDYLAPDALAILNGDDPLVMAQSFRVKGDTVTFGLRDTCDLKAEDVELDACGNARFRVDDTIFQLSVPGKYSVYNALAALSVGLFLEADLRDAQQALAQSLPSPMRMEVLKRRGIHIINDAYNANPASAKSALDVLRGFSIDPHGRRIAILGDMLELGSSAQDLHRDLGYYAARSGIDYLLGLGPLSESTCEGALEAGMTDQQVHHLVSHDAVIQWINGFCRAGDIVLVKGSRGMKMEYIVQAID